MLAQKWLSGVNRIKTEYDGWLEQHLRLPDKFDPDTTPACLANIAERIVFTDDVPSLLYEMHKNKQITYKGMFASARMPFDCFWVEYKSGLGTVQDQTETVTGVHYGALVQRHGNGVRMVIVLGFAFNFTKHPLCAITHAIEFDEWPIKIYPSSKDDNKHAIKFRIAWSLPDQEFDSPDGPICLDAPDRDVVGNIMSELVFGIFLVTQPKVYTEELIQWDERKQLARARNGDKPLLEYRKITLRICKDAKRYSHNGARPQRGPLVDHGDTESDDAIRHRRYHKVMGHFRHYLSAIPPRTIWIEPFYRGDPSLGVTFTERDVTK